MSVTHVRQNEGKTKEVVVRTMLESGVSKSW